MGSSFVVVSEQ